MAQRRMMALAVVDTDEFLDLPVSSQALYFHLNVRADDDGFISAPRKITRLVGCNDDDLKLLFTKGLVIPFESGVVVLRDWLLSNRVKPDRYHATVYQAEKALLTTDDSMRYRIGTKLEPSWSQVGAMPEPESSLVEVSQEQDRKEKKRAPRFTPPTVDEVCGYVREAGLHVDAVAFVDFYESCGWMIGKKPMKNWKAAARNWERNERRFGHGNSARSRGGTQAAGDRVPGQRDLYEEV